ncbi:hypothetical protein B0H14DRAFT_2968764 [Mycena olivaceomarginata]|nr:hypothetical protein B0H14DRAFT_2968764 [Mycena olivaceomarginata]
MLVRIQIPSRMAPCASCTIRATPPSRFRLLTVRPACSARGVGEHRRRFRVCEGRVWGGDSTRTNERDAQVDDQVFVWQEELYRLVRGAGLDARAPGSSVSHPRRPSFDAPRAPILLPLAGPSSSSARTFALAHTDNAFPPSSCAPPPRVPSPSRLRPRPRPRPAHLILVCDRRSSASPPFGATPSPRTGVEKWQPCTGRWGGAHTIMMRAQLKLVLRTARR